MNRFEKQKLGYRLNMHRFDTPSANVLVECPELFSISVAAVKQRQSDTSFIVHSCSARVFVPVGGVIVCTAVIQ